MCVFSGECWRRWFQLDQIAPDIDDDYFQGIDEFDEDDPHIPQGEVVANLLQEAQISGEQKRCDICNALPVIVNDWGIVIQHFYQIFPGLSTKWSFNTVCLMSIFKIWTCYLKVTSRAVIRGGRPPPHLTVPKGQK